MVEFLVIEISDDDEVYSNVERQINIRWIRENTTITIL